MRVLPGAHVLLFVGNLSIYTDVVVVVVVVSVVVNISRNSASSSKSRYVTTYNCAAHSKRHNYGLFPCHTSELYLPHARTSQASINGLNVSSNREAEGRNGEKRTIREDEASFDTVPETVITQLAFGNSTRMKRNRRLRVLLLNTFLIFSFSFTKKVFTYLEGSQEKNGVVLANRSLSRT